MEAFKFSMKAHCISIMNRFDSGEQLQDACLEGDLKKVKKLVKKNGQELVNRHQSSAGYTPLHAACMMGRCDVVEWLVEHGGANPNPKTKLQASPLRLAIANYFMGIDETQVLRMVEALCKNGADVCEASNGTKTPVMAACERGYETVARLLVEYGAPMPQYLVSIDQAKVQRQEQKLKQEAQKQKRLEEERKDFYDVLFDQDSSLSNEARLERLASKCLHVHHLKLYYFFVKICFQHQLVSMATAKTHLYRALSKTSRTCTSRDSVVTFKMILSRSREAGLLSERNFLELDNIAEDTRTEHTPFIQEMRQEIRSNTARIEGLEKAVLALGRNVQMVHQSHENLRSAMRFKLRMDGAVGLVSAVMNAVSMGTAGSILQAIVNGVVDFSDGEHILEVIEDVKGAAGDTPEKTAFQKGKDMAVQALDMAASHKANSKLNNALRKGDPLTVLGITSAMAKPRSC